MIWKFGRKLLTLGLAGILSAALWSGGVASAQEIDTQNLLQRLERLEKQNEELRQRLLQPVATEEGSPGADAKALDAKGVEKIIGTYMKKKDEEKKKKDEEKKKTDEEKKKDFVEVGSDLSMKATWKDGVYFETPNKDFKFHVGGRLQFDTGWFDPTPINQLPRYDDGSGFRRGRLRADGTCWEVFNWVAEFDFATVTNTGAFSAFNTSTSSNFTDVYAEVTQLPILGTFRIGRFKEPWSLEELISDNFINTMERSIIQEAFSPARGNGVAIFQTLFHDRMTFGTGLFRTDTEQGPLANAPGFPNPVFAGNGAFSIGGGQWSSTSRVTFLPYWENEGRCLVHLGANYSHQNYNPSFILPRFQARGLYRVGAQPQLVSTGTGSPATNPLANSDHIDMALGEFAGNWGSFSWMTEVAAAQVQSNGTGARNNNNPLYWGYYAQVSYFLTGEHRPYDKKNGIFTRVKPHENFFLVKGCEEDGHNWLSGRGAWEFVARYAYLDLSTDGYVNPTGADRSGGTGVLQDMTLGLNWYWNPNMHWSLNYGVAIRQSDTANRDGTVNAVGLRFHCDF